MVKAKPVIKAAALENTIKASTDSLTTACSNAVTAVTKKTAEAKKLTLTKRNRTAAAKSKIAPNATNKKALIAVAKDLKAAMTALDKARASKAVVSTELAALKAAAKRLTAYTKAIAAADKVLNKPAKKRIKRKVAK